MRPIDLQLIGKELAIKWNDGTESFIPLDRLRRGCPCAGCQGERDILGRLHKGPDHPLTPAGFQIRSLNPVGSYAIQPTWADGHNTGLYTFDYLRQLAEAPEET